MPWVAEIVQVVVEMQLTAAPQAFAVALFLLWSLTLATTSARTRRVVELLSLVVALGYGLWSAWSIRWLCDDAHISFRYAKNLLAGEGLVFNPGERVEGYTNFLWTVLLALVGKPWSIPHAALLLGPLSYVALVAGVWRLGRSTRGNLAVPLAAVVVATSRPFVLFATSGLETLFALAWCVWAAVAWQAGRLTRAGVLFALGAMARPDHLLLALGAWLVTLVSSELPWRSRFVSLARLASPTLALFGVYWLLRWGYYGDFVPNTFRTKSGGGAYWSQGLVYLTHGFLASGLVLAIPPVLLGFFGSRGDPARRRLVLLGISVALTHGLYVVRVGGDFMEFRFLLPTFAFLLVALEASMSHVLSRAAVPTSGRWGLAPLLLLVWSVPLHDVRPIAPWAKRWHLAAEETFYPLETVWPQVRVRGNNAELGEFLAREVRPALPDIRFAIGVIGIIGYTSELALVDTLGLTSRTVASQPLTSRGRPGHEKLATVDSLLAERASFSDGIFWPGHDDDIRLVFWPYTFYLVRHDPALQSLAQAKGWQYPDPIQRANTFLARPRARSELEAQRDFYRRFLSGTPAAERVEVMFQRRLGGEGLEAMDPRTLPSSEVPDRLDEAESFKSPLAADLSKRVLFRLSFEDSSGPEPEVAQGDVWPPSEGAVGAQQPIAGLQGRRLVNTFHPSDASTGRLEWPLPAVPGAELTLRVGGGGDCQRTAVLLLDGDREVMRWCGENREDLRRVHWPLSGLRQPRIAVVDESTVDWGHVLVDDIMVVAAPEHP